MLCSFSSLFLFELLVQLFLYLLLELLFTKSFEFFFFLEEFSVEFYQCSPFIIVVSFDLIYGFRCDWASIRKFVPCFWRSTWTYRCFVLISSLYLLYFFSWFLSWDLTFLLLSVTLLLILSRSGRVLAFFYIKKIDTTFVIFTIIFNSFCDLLLENSKRILSDFFLGEVLDHDLIDKFNNIFVSFGEIFIKFISNHGSKLLSLLDSLSLLDGRVQFSTFTWCVGFGVVLGLTHL